MATLAIRGHKTRGKEVIEILEMLGGKTFIKLTGTATRCGYCINQNGYIGYVKSGCSNYNVIEYTLEEFLKKYPYKVGDRAIFIKYGDNDVVTIESMSWTGTTIEYNYNGGASCLAKDLQPYKNKSTEDKSDLLQQLKEYFDNTPREIVEKEWHEYDKYNEIGPKVNEYLEYVNNIRHHKYPKTYEECCEVLGIDTQFCMKYLPHGTFSYKETIIYNLQELLICRDAYWKIAGEEMGLGKPWEPRETKDKYIIRRTGDTIVKGYTISSVLEFPTLEIRDVFYENFKELIEQCKELL